MPAMLILGATSDLAKECVKLLLSAGWTLHLAARSEKALAAFAAELADCDPMVAGQIFCHHFDALDEAPGLLALWEEVKADCEAVLCAVGMLGDQEQARRDPQYAAQIMRVNFTGLVPILAAIADDFESRGRGQILVISSVAGLRGRASNYVYGAAKAGMNAFLSGLSQRLYVKGVVVTTVLPGYIRTKMIAHKQTSALLTISAPKAACYVVRAFRTKSTVCYVPGFWRWILLAARLIPNFIYRRLYKL